MSERCNGPPMTVLQYRIRDEPGRNDGAARGKMEWHGIWLEKHGGILEELTWPMAKRLKLFGITWDYIFSRENKPFQRIFFQGPGRLSELKGVNIFATILDLLKGDFICCTY